MTGPWEKYRAAGPAPVAQTGPWDRYRSQSYGEPEAVMEVEPSGEQTVNIGAKGDKVPPGAFGSRPMTDVSGEFFNSATLGWGDEIVAGMTTPIEMAVNAVTGEGPTSPGEAYRQIRSHQAAQRAATKEQRPYASAAAGIGGAFMPSGGGLRFIRAGTNIGQKMVRGAGVGTAIGGAGGFGEGESLPERLDNAKRGAIATGVVGGLLPPVGYGAGRAYQAGKTLLRATSAPLRSLQNKEGFAAGKVAEALNRDLMTPERTANRLASNQSVKRDLVLADVAGKNTSSLLRAAGNIPSQNREKLSRTLTRRQDQQLNRLRVDLGKAFGDPKDFHATVENLTLARRNAAKPLFDQAFNTPTPFTMTLESVLRRPLTQKLWRAAEEAAANRGEQFRHVFINKNGQKIRVPDTEGLHRIKMHIDDMINAVKKRQETGLGNVNIRDLTILKRDLLNAINNAPYKHALRQYAGDSAAVNAINDGYEQALTMEPEAIRKTLFDLAYASPGDAALWRMGFARRIVEQLRDTGRTGTNRADVLFSPKYIDRMQAAFKDLQAGREFMQRLRLEQRMAKTRQAVEGNSTTAQQLAEGQEGAAEAERIRQNASLAGNLVQGNFGSAMMNWISRAKNAFTGMRPEVADEIIRMLTSKDPAVVRRAQQLVDQQTQALNRRQGAPQRVDDLINLGGLAASSHYSQ